MKRLPVVNERRGKYKIAYEPQDFVSLNKLLDGAFQSERLTNEMREVAMCLRRQIDHFYTGVIRGDVYVRQKDFETLRKVLQLGYDCSRTCYGDEWWLIDETNKLIKRALQITPPPVPPVRLPWEEDVVQPNTNKAEEG